MSAFDTECLRCHGKGVAPAPQVQAAPVAPPPSQQATPSHYSRFCPHCATGMSAVMTICPNCHKKNTSPAVAAPTSNARAVQAGVFVGAAVIGLVFFGVKSYDSQRPRTAAAPAPTLAPPVVAATPVPVIATPKPTPPPQKKPTRVLQPVETPKFRTLNTTPTRLVESIGEQIRSASTVDDLEAVRGSIAYISTKFSMQKRDLDERGRYMESARGPGMMESAMNSLWQAVDQKRLALRNETGMGNAYLQACDQQIRGAEIIAGQAQGDITLNIPQ